MAEDTRLEIRLSTELKSELAEVAARRGASVADVIRAAARLWLDLQRSNPAIARATLDKCEEM